MSTVKLGNSNEDFFKKYDRKFIQLSRNVAILIHIFEKDPDHSWEDVWLRDFTGVCERDHLLYKEAAKQFIDQLEGNWCRAFLMALKEVCEERIEQDLIDCGLKPKKDEDSSNK